MSVQPRFLHVTYTTQNAPVRWQTVQQVLESHSLDWMRYAPNSYVIWTVASAQSIGLALREVTGIPQNCLVVNQLHRPDNWVALPTWAWEWLRKDRRPEPPEPTIRPAGESPKLPGPTLPPGHTR